MMEEEALKTLLTSFGQTGLVNHLATLVGEEKAAFMKELASIDFEEMSGIFAEAMRKGSM